MMNMSPIKESETQIINHNQDVGEKSPPEIDEEQYYAAFSHPLRRQIILLLGKSKHTGFSEIKKTLKISTGAIYHHIESMGECITQDSKKKYNLTNLGNKVFHFINQSEIKDNSGIKSEKEITTQTDQNFEVKMRRILQKSLIIFLYPYFSKKFSNIKKYNFFYSHIIIISLALLCGIFNLQTFLFYFSTNNPIWNEWFSQLIFSQILTFISVSIARI